MLRPSRRLATARRGKVAARRMNEIDRAVREVIFPGSDAVKRGGAGNRVELDSSLEGHEIAEEWQPAPGVVAASGRRIGFGN